MSRPYVSVEDVHRGRAEVDVSQLETTFISPRKEIDITWRQVVEGAHGEALFCDRLFSAVKIGEPFEFIGSQVVCLEKRTVGREKVPALFCAYKNKSGAILEIELTYRHIKGIKP